MALTPKQEKFAQAIADGNTQADAYRIAFDVSPSTKPETIQKRASELMTPNGEVAGRVKSLRDALSEKALWTREDSVRTLAEIADGVGQDPRQSDRVSAVKELNAMHGWNAPVKSEVVVSQKAAVDLDDDELASIASGH